VGFVFDLIWTINSSNAWMGFFSMVLYAVGVYVSLQALARKNFSTQKIKSSCINLLVMEIYDTMSLFECSKPTNFSTDQTIGDIPKGTGCLRQSNLCL